MKNTATPNIVDLIREHTTQGRAIIKIDPDAGHVWSIGHTHLFKGTVGDETCACIPINTRFALSRTHESAEHEMPWKARMTCAKLLIEVHEFWQKAEPSEFLDMRQARRSGTLKFTPHIYRATGEGVHVCTIIDGDVLGTSEGDTPEAAFANAMNALMRASSSRQKAIDGLVTAFTVLRWPTALEALEGPEAAYDYYASSEGGRARDEAAWLVEEALVEYAKALRSSEQGFIEPRINKAIEEVQRGEPSRDVDLVIWAGHPAGGMTLTFTGDGISVKGLAPGGVDTSAYDETMTGLRAALLEADKRSSERVTELVAERTPVTPGEVPAGFEGDDIPPQ